MPLLPQRLVLDRLDKDVEVEQKYYKVTVPETNELQTGPVRAGKAVITVLPPPQQRRDAIAG